MPDPADGEISEVISWQTVRGNMRTSKRPNDWWLGDGDTYRRAQEAKGVVLAQMAEAEAVLVHAAATVFGLDTVSALHMRLAQRQLLDRRPAHQLRQDVRLGLKARGLSGPFDPQLQVLEAAFDRRNALAHGNLEVRGEGRA